MKKIEEYSIFIKYYNFLKYMSDRIEKFPRTSKFTLGDRILNLLYDIMDIIIECIYSKQKFEKLININLLLEKLRIYARLSLENKYISIKQGEYIFNEINEIGKMVGGWIKICKE